MKRKLHLAHVIKLLNPKAQKKIIKKLPEKMDNMFEEQVGFK